MIQETTYVNPQVSLYLAILVTINLLLVGLAWHNLKEIRKYLKEFIAGDKAERIAAALEKVRLAESVRREFLSHRHDDVGRVICGND